MNNNNYEILKLLSEITNIKNAIDKKKQKIEKKNNQLKLIYLTVSNILTNKELLNKQKDINNLITQISTYEKEIIVLEKTIIDKESEIDELKSYDSEFTNQIKMEEMAYSKLPEKITVLFIASNPQNSSNLKLDEEIRDLSEKIRASKYREAIEIKSIWATRTKDLIQNLNEIKPTIVHFSGHGSSNDELILQDEESNYKAVSMNAIIEMFKSLTFGIKLAFFNNCFSNNIANLVSNVTTSAIGMNTSISDIAAKLFSTQFYSSIASGCNLEQAFIQAKVSLMLEGIEEAETPQLFVKKGMDAKEIYLLRYNTDKEESLILKIEEEEIRYEKKLISFEKDIIKIYAYTHIIGIRAEYEWIKKKYPKANILLQSLTDLKMLTQDNDIKNNIYFDILKIELPDKRIKEIYFDISEFFKDGIVTSSTNSSEYFSNKLKEIYNV